MTIEYQKVPAYLRLAAQLRRWIIAENLQPGAVMPSQAEVHARYGVSKPIARLALQALEQEGIISSGQGKKSVLERVPNLDEDGEAVERPAGVAAIMRRLDHIEDAMTALAARIDQMEQVRTPAGRRGRSARPAATPDEQVAPR